MAASSNPHRDDAVGRRTFEDANLRLAMGRKIKKTVVYRGFFGEKHIESRWVDEHSGCLTAIGAIVLLFCLTSYFRGCG